MRLILPVLIAVLLIASPARAEWTLDSAALAQLSRGEVHAEVHPDGDGVSGVVRGAVEIEASPDTVWRTITNCQGAGRMAPSVKSCRVTARDPEGRWDIREMIIRGGIMPSFRTEFRSDFTPLRSIRFRCTAGDIRYCRGEWRLEPLSGGRTRVTYENRASSPFPAPAVVARVAMRLDLADALRALRREAEATER
jgi:ribosome-associated toxin RatA of RatAB toxin-antitoxin module